MMNEISLHNPSLKVDQQKYPSKWVQSLPLYACDSIYLLCCEKHTALSHSHSLTDTDIAPYVSFLCESCSSDHTTQNSEKT